MKNENTVDFPWIVKVITRHKWLIICLLAIAIVASLGFTLILPPGYKATTTLMIEPSESYKTSEINMLMAGERLALTYSYIINSQPVLEKVISKLNIDLSVAELAGMITVQPIEKTQLVHLSVNNPSANQAVALANTIAESFISYTKNLTTENYNQALDNNQKSIDLKKAEINSIITNIDAQNKLKTNLGSELSRLQLLFSENRDNYSTLQQNVQSLELTVNQSASKIRIVEPAFIANPAQIPSIATFLIFFDKEMVSGSTETALRVGDLILQIYGPMLSREALLNKVISKLGLSESTASLSRRITYDSIIGTQFLKINVRGDNPAQAISIADAIADAFIEQNQNIMAKPYNNQLINLKTQMNELSTQIVKIQEDINNNSTKTIPVDLEIERLKSELASKYLDLRNLQTNYDLLFLESGRATNTVLISEPATQAKKQIQNNFIYSGIAILLAFFVGIAGVFILEHFDDKVRTQADISALLDANPIGSIGYIDRGKDKLVLGSNSSPHISEDFRKLSAALRPVLKELPIRTLLVTSSHSGEGKSVIVANLGLAFAKAGTRVIIVDADLHLPRQHVLFNVDLQGGLSESLSSNLVEPELKATLTPNLRLLTSGKLPDDPVEHLTSPYLERVINTLSDMADLVIIDCPPIATLADASYITPYVDGSLLILRSGITKRKAALEAAIILKNTGIKYMGIVLNGVIQSSDSFYKYYLEKNGES